MPESLIFITEHSCEAEVPEPYGDDSDSVTGKSGKNRLRGMTSIASVFLSGRMPDISV